MQNVNFETTIKDGYIKIPKKYAGFNNQKVIVEIHKPAIDQETNRADRVEKFIRRYRGMLKHENISHDIKAKDIRAMRLDEKDFKNKWVKVQTPEAYLSSNPRS